MSARLGLQSPSWELKSSYQHRQEGIFSKMFAPPGPYDCPGKWAKSSYWCFCPVEIAGMTWYWFANFSCLSKLSRSMWNLNRRWTWQALTTWSQHNMLTDCSQESILCQRDRLENAQAYLPRSAPALWARRLRVCQLELHMRSHISGENLHSPRPLPAPR